MLVVSYGLNVGVYYALSTLLNQLIKPTFLDNDSYPNEFLASLDAKIGQMGTVMVSLKYTKYMGQDHYDTWLGCGPGA